MNCKPGDIAIIVRSEAGNVGRIVEVGEWCEALMHPCLLNVESGWEVRGNLLARNGLGDVMPVNFGVVPDARLRPLRDNEGEDEILRIAGKPVGHEVPA